MAKRIAMKLDDVIAKKPAATVSAIPAPAEGSSGPKRAGDGRKGQTVRLSPAAWAQLKILAVNEEKAAHDLIIEAINMMFISRNLSPIA